MKAVFLLCLFMLPALLTFGQTQQKLSVDVSLKGIKTLYDKVAFSDNSQQGYGLGATLYLNLDSKFKPYLEVASDGYGVTYAAIDRKVAGKSVHKYIVNNIFIGSSYKVARRFRVSCVIGTSFINSYVYLGIKPGLQYSFGKKEKVSARLSLTHILTKYGGEVEPLGYLSLGVGYKLF